MMPLADSVSPYSAQCCWIRQASPLEKSVGAETGPQNGNRGQPTLKQTLGQRLCIRVERTVANS